MAVQTMKKWKQHSFRAGIAVATTTALVLTLFSGTGPAQAAGASGFPDPQKDPKVTGELASARSAAKPAPPKKSPAVKESKGAKFSVPLTSKGARTAKSDDAGVLVRDAGSTSGESVQVDVWGHDRLKKFGDARFAIGITPTAKGKHKLDVVLSDKAVAPAFGGDYASRLNWVLVPAAGAEDAALVDAMPVTPEAAEDGLTFAVQSAEPMVLAAVATTSSMSGSGTYSATSLKPASTWDVSAQTGAFSWSYPIPVPPAPAGASPEVALQYNSQLVDGATSSTNNQPSAVGEGWTLSGGGFIERRYVTCATEQAPGAPVAGSGDLCWATDNATISFGSTSGTLVRDSASGKWKLEGDDNSRVEKLLGTAQGCAANGTYNTECWRLTTTDGTQYYFGLNRLPGWASGKRTTNSVFTVPVFGNDAADPCHASTFAASSCVQGWRWNLDYVVDVNGNAQAMYYAAETNKYRLNNATVTSYVRGGQLTSIEYGLTASTVQATNAATSKVVFGYDKNGRCNPANAASCSPIALGGDATTPATPSVYPDVPFDLNCTTGACTSMRSPSFWSTARLASITTQSFTGGAYKTADAFTLKHSFPDPGDAESPALWLNSVTRTATAGATAITEAPTTFVGVPMQNRVWVFDGVAPLDKFRVSGVLLPTGGRISVNYSDPECKPEDEASILASQWSNDKRCFPEWWTPDLDIPTEAQQDLFHKYVVTSMVEDPYTGGAGSPAIETAYVYTGKPAWRYNDDRLIPANRRTWSDYAGYDKVEVRVGDHATPAKQETTQYLFYRGLNGDRANASGGTKTVTVTGTSVPDERWFGGQTRSAKVLNGAGGAVLSETVTTPWASAVTSSDGVHKARVLGLSRTDTTVPVSTGGTRTTSSINTMDARGFVLSTEASAGSGQRVTCTTTQYAADNTTTGVIGLPSVNVTYSVPCAQVSTAPIPASVLSYARIAYDGGAVGAAASKGHVTTTTEAKGFTGTTLASAQWVSTGQMTYDALGRTASITDAAGRLVKTAYTPAAGAAGSGPLTATAVTNPAGWVSTTTVDPYRGLPVTAVDENGKTTSTEYDALGRLTKVWRTDRPKTTYPTAPSTSYVYKVSTTVPSSIAETTLTAKGTLTTYQLVDGLGRTVQTQTPAPGGGAVISDAEYDQAGRSSATNDKYWAPTVTPGTTLFVPATSAQVASRTETVYDGAGRATATILRSLGTEVRRSSVVYRGSDRVDGTPPAGGVPTSTYADAWGRTTRVQQWHGAIDGAGVGSTSLRYEYNARDQMTRMTDDAGNAWTWAFDLRGRQTGSSDPDAGASTATYDDLGNLVTNSDARGTVLAYTYDALNRKTSERSGSVTGTVLASWVYDTLAKGLLTSSSRFVDGKEYKTQTTGYDNGYRSTGSKVLIPAGAPAFPSTTYTTSTYYNPDGTVAATVLPAAGGLPAEELYPAYNSLGQMSSLSGAAGYASDISYLASGQVSQITRAGTVWSALTLSYATGTRELASLEETTRRGGTTFTQEALRTYTRNSADIITKAVTKAASHAADVQCFTYGPLQAMTAAWASNNTDCTGGPTAALGGPAPYSAQYTVDPATGNRTASTLKVGATGTPTTSTYTYPAAGAARPHAVTQVAATTGTSTVTSGYQYDASGAMTKRAAQTVTYDQSGRLSSVVDGTKTENSIYTADGQLLLRYGGSDGASLFLSDTVLRTVGTTTTGVRSYQVAGINIAERTSGTGGGLWWLSPDPVGTVGMQINAATGTVTRRWMDPYGGARGGPSTWSSNFGYLNAPRSATGLTQLGARAYDAGLGRFVSVDPVLDPGEPRHANAYAYSMNSPVSFSDPTGLFWRIDSADNSQHVTPAQSRAVGHANSHRKRSSSVTAGSNVGSPKGASRGGPKAAPVAAAGNSDYATAFTPLLSPADDAWYRELEAMDGYCSDSDPDTPCGADWIAEQVTGTADIAMMAIPGGWLVKGLRATSIIGDSVGGGGQGRSNVGNSGSKPLSVNQMNKSIERGLAPRGVTRVDTAKVKGEQDHVHFRDGGALNRDGTWKHGETRLTKRQVEWLQGNGWRIPGE